MKNLYFFQVNYSYGESVHPPYTAAALSAYAFDNEHIKNNYELKEIFFLRDSKKVFLDKIESPDVAAFSTYMWNYEFNKALAKSIKEKYPACTVIFGGHSIAPGDSFLEECPDADFAIHGEGEEAFTRLLLSVIGKDDYKDIPGISYRDNGKVITTPSAPVPTEKEINYPSPYLEGYFDKILEEHKDVYFMGLIETSRGCPYSCAYCDWSNMKSKIRTVPMEKIKAEIRWMFEHKFIGFGTADSNFGFFERDEEIIDYIIELNKTYKTLRGFQTSYAKNSNERIFRIGKKLHESGLNRGITLSFQSMNDEVLDIIGRKNIPVSSYKELMNMYNEAGIGTYTELILGLPGETYDSFAQGIEMLLAMGQHNSVYIHNCECLPCSIMAQPSYREKYKIGTSRILLNQPHIEDREEEIREYSSLVTSTFSMSGAEWIRTNLYSFTVQCFHHYGLSEFLAIYLHNEKGVSYKEVYEKILEASEDESFPLLYKIYSFVKNKLQDILDETKDASFTVADRCFGNVRWGFEEYIFLKAVYEYEELSRELNRIFSVYSDGDEIFSQLLSFQKEMIKCPDETDKCLHYSYDFTSYFKDVFKGLLPALQKKENNIYIKTKAFPDWETYSKFMVWYGKKESRSICLNDAEVVYGDEI